MTNGMKLLVICQTLALFAIGCWIMHWHAHSRWEYTAAAYFGAQASYIAVKSFKMPFWKDHSFDGYDVGVWLFMFLCWMR